MSIKFLNNKGDFSLDMANETSYLYFPVANEKVMGSITPDLKGDSKLGQNEFIMEPVSSENLHTSMMGRNLWVKINGTDVWSIAGTSATQQASMYTADKDEVEVNAGKLWHKVTRTNKGLGIRADVLSYCPATNEQAEIMKVTFTNLNEESMELLPTVAVPLYGRSADNLRDHRHVTSLLHRIKVREEGIVVTPTLSFDERGHKINHMSYGVFAKEDNGNRPVGFFPVLEEFVGEGGNLNWPHAVVLNDAVMYQAGDTIDGFEAMGGIRFAATTLASGAAKTYYVVLSYNEEGLMFLDPVEEEKAFQSNCEYWDTQSTISCQSFDTSFDNWVSWVGIQPTLRRIYGCSFLPHHDYGRGGRGWRDLWQDSLALLLMNPDTVRERLISYYGGVRIDGSNATIIGAKPGEFVADRNSIVRVWMDHGLWPFITTNLYINQTGDADILFEENTFFKDAISNRGDEKDGLWDGVSNKLKTYSDNVYKGTILEHILIQHLTAFYDVGEHNHMKLRGGDWNDALDMAKENGESVAFTAAYAGNLLQLAKLLQWVREEKQVAEIELSEELTALLHPTEEVYQSATRKQEVLQNYCNSCNSYISGNKAKVPVATIEEDLIAKAEWIRKHIRGQEWVTDMAGHNWFNGYYDNSKQQVEGVVNDSVRVMLTSQVFSIMSGTATDEQVSQIVKAVDHYLFDEAIGGYRLNTDFGEMKKDLGRMFGFAYGHKENGAVFSHMAVMYAYSLYSRGFVTEGYKVINTIFKHAMKFETSRIYPGIPEYFNSKGRGLYHYLTGAASWYMLTTLTQMYGVKGSFGDLVVCPQLVKEQFDEEGIASIVSSFAGRQIKVVYENKKHKEIGDYEIEEIYIDGVLYELKSEEGRITRAELETLKQDTEHVIKVVLV